MMNSKFTALIQVLNKDFTVLITSSKHLSSRCDTSSKQ